MSAGPGDPAAVWWVKSRWKCDAPGCDRKTFTEWLPQVPPRCLLTARLREQALPLMTRSPPPWDPCWSRPRLVAHLGIDEHRRGLPVAHR